MKTSTKWIIGIVIALLAVCVLAGAVFAGVSVIGRSSWQMGTRYGHLWGDQDQIMPWGETPNQPGQHMWMNPQRGVNGVRFGFFSPLRMLALPLLCLGFLALLIIGIVLLIRRSSRSKSTASPAEPIPTPAPVVNEPPVAAPVCPNCARNVESEWSHCPYCGAPLS
jgi:hypothetical protein